MSKNILLKRKIIFAVIILFIGTSLAPTMLGDTVEKAPFLITCESVEATSSINKGSLSGYVNNTLMRHMKKIIPILLDIIMLRIFRYVFALRILLHQNQDIQLSGSY